MGNRISKLGDIIHWVSDPGILEFIIFVTVATPQTVRYGLDRVPSKICDLLEWLYHVLLNGVDDALYYTRCYTIDVEYWARQQVIHGRFWLRGKSIKVGHWLHCTRLALQNDIKVPIGRLFYEITMFLKLFCCNAWPGTDLSFARLAAVRIFVCFPTSFKNTANSKFFAAAIDSGLAARMAVPRVQDLARIRHHQHRQLVANKGRSVQLARISHLEFPPCQTRHRSLKLCP